VAVAVDEAPKEHSLDRMTAVFALWLLLHNPANFGIDAHGWNLMAFVT
jgi:hypothetical protein